MFLFFWIIILLASIWASHWGADKLAKSLQKLRQQWGLTEVGGAALIALATASPEMRTNTVSALQGVSDIGLGNLLGSNIISVPVIVTVAYFAAQYYSDQPSFFNPDDNSLSSSLSLKPEALPIQAIPYLGVIILVAILTLTPPWQGLQPIDG
jgi:cation:H+ antiporter